MLLMRMKFRDDDENDKRTSERERERERERDEGGGGERERERARRTKKKRKLLAQITSKVMTESLIDSQFSVFVSFFAYYLYFARPVCGLCLPNKP